MIGVLLTSCGRAGFDPVDDAAASTNGADAASAYVNIVMADHPLAYYRFGDASSTAARDELGGAPGTYATSGITLGAQGAIVGDPDTAVALDGSNGRIDFGDRYAFAPRAPFTIEVWAKADVVGPDVRFVMSQGPQSTSGDGYDIYFNVAAPDYTLFSRRGNSQSSYAQGPAPATSRFVHVVATFDGATTRLYMDGTLVGQGSGPTDIMPSGPGGFVLGDAVSGQFYKFAGAFDELAIYDIALPVERIQAHHTVGTGG